jgi:hypothetical protein
MTLGRGFLVVGAAADLSRLDCVIVVDPPEPSPSEPSPSPRVYKREWSPSYWRGSLDEVVGAARAALDEIKRQRPGEMFEENISLDFDDASTQDFGSLDGLQEAVSTVDIADVTGLRIGFPVDVNTSVQIWASSFGLSVKAEGSEAFASGMVATLKSRLAGGAEAGDQAARIPLRFIDWFLLGLIPVAFFGSQFFLYSTSEHDDKLWFLFMGIAAAMIPAFIAGGVFFDGMENRLPPSFVLVAEGEQFPDEGEERTGPVWRAKAWFEKHPVVALMLVLIVGALLGRAAELLKF